MVNLTARNTEQLRATLQDAVVKCSERSLYQSAKWAAELLTSLPSPGDITPISDTDSDSPMRDTEHPITSTTIAITTSIDPEERLLESQEIHKYLLAKSYFDCREYDRCTAVFLPSTLPHGPISGTPSSAKLHSPTASKGKSKSSTPGGQTTTIPPPNTFPRLSQRSLFLALYAKYMSGEKKKDEESEMILGPADGGITINRELVGIGRGLEGWFAQRAKEAGGDEQKACGQGWLEYLYGIVLLKGKNEEEAKKWLVKSVHLYPFNWGAWLELSELVGSVEELHRIAPELPQNIMTFVFHLYTSQELYQSTDQVHNSLTQLEAIFPDSQFLKTQRALLFYHSKEQPATPNAYLQDFDEAESIFSTLIQHDPHRIDSLDHYSNILYVMSLRPKLAFLAQLATSTDKFRPETCCVVGNYYSLKSEHEKAVMYFRRALTLDRGFLSAWTLMGHEYVEMKNTHAAIESYRRAVDVNRKDYRAWYGLGQTYEVLEMHFYALFYYQRAASLKPYDPKMWQAVGSCFNKMGRPVQSIKAYKRALVAGSYYDAGTSSFGSGSSGADRPAAGGVMDPETLHQIAQMYEKLGDLDEAAAFMELTLAQEEGPNAGEDDGDIRSSSLGGQGLGVGITTTTSKARMWLARWEFGRGGLDRAMVLANELCQDGVEVEEAKALVRDLRARMEGEKG
ncbi:MAG: Anaphase-promoting complex subunit 23 [Pycnora praestabilis]|nr:MAG: Anaphase-promoting complex subunit 23 [Pycnora praestabilis]